MTVYTIGHSTHSLETFLALLRAAAITAVADVRSHPMSRRLPHFNKEPLQATLREAGIAYVFLGKELGGRPSDPAMYRDGIADYERMAQSPAFREGIERVLAARGCVTLMCSEKDPRDCHRCLLVARALAERGAEVCHILADGGTVTQREIEDEMLRGKDDLFVPREASLAEAYRARARKVAFARD
jgi:uncharacterized protein (DUF488 family)